MVTVSDVEALFYTVRHSEKLRKSCSNKDRQREQKTCGLNGDTKVVSQKYSWTERFKLEIALLFNGCNLDIHTEREREQQRIRVEDSVDVTCRLKKETNKQKEGNIHNYMQRKGNRKLCDDLDDNSISFSKN